MLLRKSTLEVLVVLLGPANAKDSSRRNFAWHGGRARRSCLGCSVILGPSLVRSCMIVDYEREHFYLLLAVDILPRNWCEAA